MNRKTREEVRAGINTQMSKIRGTHFGMIAYAALLRGAEKRRQRLASIAKATTTHRDEADAK